MPPFNRFNQQSYFIDVFNTGRGFATWTAHASRNWIKLSKTSGDLRKDARVLVSIDWNKAPLGDKVNGTIEIRGAGSNRIVKVPIFNPRLPVPVAQPDFVEVNGVVSVEPEHFSKHVDRDGIGWRVIPGLGRTGESVAVFPTTVASIDPTRIAADAPVLEYSLHLFSSAQFTVTCYLVPTHPLQAGRGLRYAIGFDDQPPQLVTVEADLAVPSRQWSLNVLNASKMATSIHHIKATGPHTLKLYMIDPGVVVDKIVLDAGGLKPSYFGPPETQNRK